MKQVHMDAGRLLGYRLLVAGKSASAGQGAGVVRLDLALLAAARIGSKTGNKMGGKIGAKNNPCR